MEGASARHCKHLVPARIVCTRDASVAILLYGAVQQGYLRRGRPYRLNRVSFTRPTHISSVFSNKERVHRLLLYDLQRNLRFVSRYFVLAYLIIFLLNPPPLHPQSSAVENRTRSRTVCSKTPTQSRASRERGATLRFGTGGNRQTRYDVLSCWGRIRRVLGLLEVSSPNR